MTTIIISLGTFSSPKGSSVLLSGQCHFSRPLTPAPNYLCLPVHLTLDDKWSWPVCGLLHLIAFSFRFVCVCEQVCVRVCITTCVCMHVIFLVIFKALQAKATFLLCPYLSIWSPLPVTLAKGLLLFISVYVYSNLCECIHAYLVPAEARRGN